VHKHLLTDSRSQLATTLKQNVFGIIENLLWHTHTANFDGNKLAMTRKCAAIISWSAHVSAVTYISLMRGEQ